MSSSAESSPAFPRAVAPGSSAFFLVGPTAVGKTSVSHYLAVREGLEILSADSMLVYRGMDIGTAKPTPAEREEVPYSGLDLVDPWEIFSTGAYLAEAEETFRTAGDRRRPLIVTGGTGLYVTALVRGLDAGRAPDQALRVRLEALHREEGTDGLRAELARVAPARLAALSDPDNPRRLLRALELAHTAPAAEAMKRTLPPPHVVGLRMARKALEERIRERVDRMFGEGLLDEARNLRSLGRDLSSTAREAIGYREAFALLDGAIGEAEARERTVIRTRRLAKRQMTWFRNQAEVTWVEVEPGDRVQDLAEQVRRAWREVGPTKVVFAE